MSLLSSQISVLILFGVFGILMGVAISLIVSKISEILEHDLCLEEGQNIEGLRVRNNLINDKIIIFSSVLLSLLVASSFGFSLVTPFILIFAAGLIILTMVDIGYKILPDIIVLPLLWLGLLVNSFGLLVPLFDALWGAVIGYLSLSSVSLLYKLYAKKEGLGFGDVKLFAMIGAWLGWQKLPVILMVSSLSGILVALSLIFLSKSDKNTVIAYGPFLALAALISVFYPM